MAKQRRLDPGIDAVEDVQSAIALIRTGRISEAKAVVQRWKSDDWEVHGVKDNSAWSRLWSFVEFLELDGSITPAVGETMRNDLTRLIPRD